MRGVAKNLESVGGGTGIFKNVSWVKQKTATEMMIDLLYLHSVIYHKLASQ